MIRIAVPTLLVFLAALPAQAQEQPLLTSVPTACAALEALISFELIEGGEASDTVALAEIAKGHDSTACAAELDRLGFGHGLESPTCREALNLIAAFGPPSAEADPGALIHDILTGAAPEACALTVEFYAAQ